MAEIVVLTGAGISAESGIATFRGDAGLWAGHRVEDVCTPQAIESDPDFVHRFYDARRSDVAAAEPNAAHIAIARLAEFYGDSLLVVTQNIDDLHERAVTETGHQLGASQLIHMHGELRSALCETCGARERTTAGSIGMCDRCGVRMRPDIVFFGERPHHQTRIEDAVRGCSLFVAIGTSGNVYPAAGYTALARMSYANLIEINLNPVGGYDLTYEGPATETVPQWVDAMTTGSRA